MVLTSTQTNAAGLIRTIAIPSMISSVTTGSSSQIPNVDSTTPHSRPHGPHRGKPDLATDIINSADTDGDGSISQDELTALIDKNSGTTSTTSDVSSKVDDLFKQLDTNGDGQVSKSELTAALKQAHEAMKSGSTDSSTSSGFASLIGALMPPPPAIYDASGSSTVSALSNSTSTFSAVA